MSEQKYTWEQLNAYVDGELSPKTASQLATAAAEDPDLAQAIAALSDLKAASQQALEFDNDDAPAIPHLPAGGRPGGPGWKWPCALAASLLAMAIASGAVWYGLQGQNGSDNWITAAQEQHQEWIDSDSEAPASDPSVQDSRKASDVLVEVSVDGTVGYAPSLALAGMRITRFSSQRDGRDEYFFVGYLGQNGCQLSLTITKAPENQQVDLSLEWQEDDQALASWRVGDTAYAAVSQGMDKQRFRRLTAHLEKTTREAGALQQETRMAESARSSDRPCLG